MYSFWFLNKYGVKRAVMFVAIELCGLARLE